MMIRLAFVNTSYPAPSCSDTYGYDLTAQIDRALKVGLDLRDTGNLLHTHDVVNIA